MPKVITSDPKIKIQIVLNKLTRANIHLSNVSNSTPDSVSELANQTKCLIDEAKAMLGSITSP